MERFLQSGYINWFDKMTVEATFPGSTLILAAPNHSERSATWLRPGLLSDLLCGVIAIQLRHSKIHQYDVRTEGCRQFNCLLAVMSDGNLVPNLSMISPRLFCAIAVVVDNENSATAAAVWFCTVVLRRFLSYHSEGNWKMNDELAPFVQTFAFRHDTSAMHFDQSLRNVQANPRPPCDRSKDPSTCVKYRRCVRAWMSECLRRRPEQTR